MFGQRGGVEIKGGVGGGGAKTSMQQNLFGTKS